MSTSPAIAATEGGVAGIPGVARLAALLQARGPATILSGAGCSTASGIPDYRDCDGRWKQPAPMQHREFMSDAAARQRYWGRSFVGWTRFSRARPNAAHHWLAAMQAGGWVDSVITQNVDGLHQRAGQRHVIDLHGRLDRVVCMSCGRRGSRASYQHRLLAENPGLDAVGASLRSGAATRADGDVEIGDDFSGMSIPACRGCGGIIKPDVVFFGDVVPAGRVARAYDAVARSGLLLVVGSSLMVASGLRFCRRATELGRPLAIIGLGRTRADDAAQLKVVHDCALALESLAGLLPGSD